MIADDRGQSLELPDGPAFSKSFRQTFEQLLDHWTTLFRNLRVPVIPISTAEPPAAQIRELFGQQAARR
jgi:hypothetical protein